MNLNRVVITQWLLAGLLLLFPAVTFCMEGNLTAESTSTQPQQPKTIKISVEDKEYSLTKEQAEQCITLKNMLEGLEVSDEEIPLPLTSEIFDYIYSDLTKFKYDTSLIDDKTIVQLLEAANYLDCAALKTTYSQLLIQRATQGLTSENLAQRITWINNLLTSPELSTLVGAEILTNAAIQEMIKTINAPKLYTKISGNYLCSSQDGKKIIVTNMNDYSLSDNFLIVYDINSNNQLWRKNFDAFEDIIFSYFSPNDEKIIVCNNIRELISKEITIFDTKTGEEIYSQDNENLIRPYDNLSPDSTECRFFVELSPDSNRACFYSTNTISVVDLGSKKTLFEKEVSEEFSDVCFSSDGTKIALIIDQDNSNNDDSNSDSDSNDDSASDSDDEEISDILMYDAQTGDYLGNLTEYFSETYTIKNSRPINNAICSAQTEKIEIKGNGKSETFLQYFNCDTIGREGYWNLLSHSNNKESFLADNKESFAVFVFSPNQTKKIEFSGEKALLYDVTTNGNYEEEEKTKKLICEFYNVRSFVFSPDSKHILVEEHIDVEHNRKIALYETSLGTLLFEKNPHNRHFSIFCPSFIDNALFTFYTSSEKSRFYKIINVDRELSYCPADQALLLFYLAHAIKNNESIQLCKHTQNLFINLPESIQSYIEHVTICPCKCTTVFRVKATALPKISSTANTIDKYRNL